MRRSQFRILVCDWCRQPAPPEAEALPDGHLPSGWTVWNVPERGIVIYCSAQCAAAVDARRGNLLV